MKFVAIQMVWMLTVVWPAVAVWGHYAGSSGIGSLTFVFSLLYGMVFLASLPWLLLWWKPRLLSDG